MFQGIMLFICYVVIQKDVQDLMRNRFNNSLFVKKVRKISCITVCVVGY